MGIANKLQTMGSNRHIFGVRPTGYYSWPPVETNITMQGAVGPVTVEVLVYIQQSDLTGIQS